MSDIKSSHEYIEKKYELTERSAITVLEGTERPGYAVIEVDGRQDDDMPGQGDYHTETVIEVYEDETVATERVQTLNETRGVEEWRQGAGDGVVGWYTRYKTGSATLHLCMVEQREVM
jgi:hypothetical protein